MRPDIALSTLQHKHLISNIPSTITWLVTAKHVRCAYWASFCSKLTVTLNITLCLLYNTYTCSTFWVFLCSPAGLYEFYSIITNETAYVTRATRQNCFCIEQASVCLAWGPPRKGRHGNTAALKLDLTTSVSVPTKISYWHQFGLSCKKITWFIHPKESLLSTNKQSNILCSRASFWQFNAILATASRTWQNQPGWTL